MLDLLLQTSAAQPSPPLPLTAALANAAATCGRLDQVAQSHPLRPALLFRARLEAVRRMAAADGQAIDPWHLAALLEGLRLRMDWSCASSTVGRFLPRRGTRWGCIAGW